MDVKITENIKYIGVDDLSLDLFESQYSIPEGVSYNSYVILDEKIALIDTVDERKQPEWEWNLLENLDGRCVDYLIVQHLEPDHAGGILRMLEIFPEITLVGNQKTFLFLSQFMEGVDDLKKLVVKENDILSLGKHKLQFMMAHMVHWPEVMVTYETTEGILFSADAFGKFGALEKTKDEEWACEARRYYFNIVGKYGIAVQSLLKKVKSLNVQMICPAHGCILNHNLHEYIHFYDIWSQYKPETKGVLVVYGSFHGNSKKVAEYVAQKLHEKGEENVVIRDIARADMSEVIEDAFQYDRMVLTAASCDASLFPQMRDFLYRLQCKGYQNRRVALIENGTWSPSAGRIMKQILGDMKNIEILSPMVTIYSVMKSDDIIELDTLIKECL